MEYKKADSFEIIDCEKFNLLKPKNRELVRCHNDTDSVYFSIEEMFDLFPSFYGDEKKIRRFFQYAENQFDDFFKKILEIRAKKHKTDNKIKFNRENVFTGMFCFAKKLYIGDVIDSEGKPYPMDKPKHKIMGVPIKRSDMPEFCKEYAEDLSFKIANGMSQSDAEDYIIEIFKKYKQAPMDEIAAKKSISDLDKYMEGSIDDYVKNTTVNYMTGATAFAKMSINYNYTIKKYCFPLMPIFNGTKFHYLFLEENNKHKFNCIAWVGSYPSKYFDGLYTVDYELSFRKSFLPLFEKMFKILGWVTDGQIPLKKSKGALFF